MDPKLKALIEQTNLSDLLPSAPKEMDLQQPVAPPEPAKPQPARSTNDALQVYFGGTDMVGKLANAPTSGRIKTFAMILLGGPTIVLGLLLLGMVWTEPGKSVLALVYGYFLVDTYDEVLAMGVLLGIAGASFGVALSLMVWLAMIGLSLTLKTRDAVAVTMLVDAVPPDAQLVLVGDRDWNRDKARLLKHG